jgi:epoxyqueuosine reductase
MKKTIRDFAEQCGFEMCRFAHAGPAPHFGEYCSWLGSGAHGEMTWLAREPIRRSDPSLLLTEAKTLLLLAKSYYQGASPRKQAGRIARYAWGSDYHALMLAAMRPIDRLLGEFGGRQKCYVDTGPILERDFAAASGLAWHGKSTMSLNERLGTWFFIGVIVTTLEIEPDPPRKNRCGKCTRCIEACPTQAITEPYRLDARRCISYLTIENKGPIPLEFRKAIGDRIYGCDDCLEACPWNRFALKSHETRFGLPEKLRNLSLRSLASLTEEEFRTLFRHSPIKRIKRARFVRNVCVALGNVGTKEDLPVLRRLAQDPESLIAEHASWASEEIGRRLRNPCLFFQTR